MKFIIFALALFFMFIIAGSVYAEENSTINSNLSINLSDSVSDIEIVKFFPKEVKIGDVQFNIQIKNNIDHTFENLNAFISGPGFSTYEIIPIEILEPYEKDYIFVDGNMRESGEINLTIRIEKYTFYQKVSVFDVREFNDSEEEKKLQKLDELLKQLENLKKNYTSLELEISEKKDNNYDVSKINLDDLKRYLRNAESYIITEDIEQAEINLKFALEEYEYQKTRTDNAKVIPTIDRLKETALIFSAIFGSVLAFFALSELLKRKSENVFHGVVNLVKKKKGETTKTKRK